MNKRAFTLIEVIVSIALFALASVVISQSFMGGLISLERFSFIDTRDESYQAILREILANKERNTMELGGSLKTFKDGEVSWEIQIEESELPYLFRVDIKTRYLDKRKSNGPQAFTESIYTYRPEWETERDNEPLVDRDDRNSRRKERNGSDKK